MSQEAPYSVILDANIWVAERLLQTSIGSAVLYALTFARASARPNSESEPSPISRERPRRVKR